MCAGSGKVWREGAVQWVHQFRNIRRVVLWVVLQGFGTLMVVCTVGVGRAKLCGLARKGMVRGGAVIRQRRVDDGVLVERV